MGRKKDNDKTRTKSKVQFTGKLREKEDQREEQDRLEGRNSVMEAIKGNRTINKLLVQKGEKEGSIRQIIAFAREKGIVVQETDRSNLDRISTTHAHQGVIAYVSSKDYVEVDDILKNAESKKEAPFIIILDGITDAYNLGSILRTADAVGAHGVIIPKRRAIGLNAAVSKASAGAIEYVPVARVKYFSDHRVLEEKKYMGSRDRSFRRKVFL